jgi:hypothetical protein
VCKLLRKVLPTAPCCLVFGGKCELARNLLYRLYNPDPNPTMTKAFKFFSAAAAFAILNATAPLAPAAAYHGAEPSPSDGEVQLSYELSLRSSATSLSCNSGDRFSHTLSVCDAAGCHVQELDGRSKLVFRVAPKSRILVASSAAFSADGIIYGESEADELKAGAEARLVQTVTGSGGCLKSVVYDVKLVVE